MVVIYIMVTTLKKTGHGAQNELTHSQTRKDAKPTFTFMRKRTIHSTQLQSSSPLIQ